MTITVWWDIKQKKSTSDAIKCVSGKGYKMTSTVGQELI